MSLPGRHLTKSAIIQKVTYGTDFEVRTSCVVLYVYDIEFCAPIESMRLATADLPRESRHVRLMTIGQLAIKYG